MKNYQAVLLSLFLLAVGYLGFYLTAIHII